MGADYRLTAGLLASHDIDPSPAEIHGVLCGQFCAGMPGSESGLTLKILDIEADVGEVIANLVEMLGDDAQAQMQAGDFSFQPLLPSDEETLGVRLTALSSWCDGFNAGFAGAWDKGDKAMPADTREVLGDFSRIAQVDDAEEGLDASEENENEASYMEVVEYVRMAAISLFMQNSQQPYLPAGVPTNAPPGEEDVH